MISRIEIENFFSIAERQVLDFTVPANAPDLACFRDSPAAPGQRLPVAVGIYGPNASGKSTVLRAVARASVFARNSFGLAPDALIPWIHPYAQKDWLNRPTRIKLEFIGRCLEKNQPGHYRYELEISHDETRFGKSVSYESLSCAPKGRYRRVFERSGQKFSFGREFGIGDNDPRAESIRPNASVISTLAQHNHPIALELIAIFREWMTNTPFGLTKASQGLIGALNTYSERPEYRTALNRELSRLDLGLEEMELSAGRDGPRATFKHFGLDCEILLEEESTGTRRFIELFPKIQASLDSGGVAVIDELDIHVHPNLMPEIIRWYYDRRRNPKGAQLLFTAHNPAILAELEKEQVFFTEKPSGEATRVYGAREIKGLRREPSLMKKYLSGELGAVPQIG